MQNYILSSVANIHGRICFQHNSVYFLPQHRGTPFLQKTKNLRSKTAPEAKTKAYEKNYYLRNGDYFFFRYSCTLSEGTISSWKT